MSTVVYYCAASLDGYIAEADDTIGWLTSATKASPGQRRGARRGRLRAFYEGVGALVSGSVTYEFILDHLGRGRRVAVHGEALLGAQARGLPARR